MSIRWLMVQYVGNVLKLPVMDMSDVKANKPFGNSRLERDVKRIEARTHDGETVMFVPERTCRIEESYGDWYCKGCGEFIGTRNMEDESYIDSNAIETWNYCPRCGARIEVSHQWND